MHRFSNLDLVEPIASMSVKTEYLFLVKPNWFIFFYNFVQDVAFVKFYVFQLKVKENIKKFIAFLIINESAKEMPTTFKSKKGVWIKLYLILPTLTKFKASLKIHFKKTILH